MHNQERNYYPGRSTITPAHAIQNRYCFIDRCQNYGIRQSSANLNQAELQCQHEFADCGEVVLRW